MLIIPGIVGYIAMPALGALLILAGFRSLKPSDNSSVWSTGWQSRIAALVTLISTLILPIQLAVGLGVLLSALLYINRSSTDVSFEFDFWKWRNRCMINWNDYHDRVRKGIAEIGRANPDIVRGYRALGDAGKKTDLLGGKTRELIALAVAVIVQCDGCIVVHTEAALQNGATEEEILEALSVAIQVKAGSALIYSTRALDAVKAKSEQLSDKEAGSTLED